MSDHNNYETIKLYSPLSVVQVDENTGDSFDAYAAMYVMDVEDAIERDFLHDEPRGLMEYYDKQDSVNEKVYSCKPAVEFMNGKLHGVAVLQCKAPLTPTEMDQIKEYVSGQWSDGWGEGFEQRPVHTMDGDLYISFWSLDQDFYIKTADEMQQGLQERRPPKGGQSR